MSNVTAVPIHPTARGKIATASTSVPICGGENLYLRHGFRKVFEQQALDIMSTCS